MELGRGGRQSALTYSLPRPEHTGRCLLSSPQPTVIAFLAVPILIQFYFNAGFAYWLSKRLGVAWSVGAAAALIEHPTSSSWLWLPLSRFWA